MLLNKKALTFAILYVIEKKKERKKSLSIMIIALAKFFYVNISLIENKNK